MHSFQKLTSDLKNLGVNKGDTLLVRAGLRAVGQMESNHIGDFIDVLLDAVGEEGTIVGLSFTNSFFIKKNKTIIFDGTNPSYTGAFANLMLQHAGAVRSRHPTNSYVAIGKNAHFILNDHDENSGAYEPIRKIVELDGKMILIGCAGSSPGFTTTHLAEVDLGLHKRIIFPWLTGAYYKKDGTIRLFKRPDLGSCSSTFYRFYGHYIKHELLRQGYVGDAYSILINAKKAYALDLQILEEDPRITICNNPACRLCRARRWDNLIDLPLYVARLLKRRLFG